MTIFATPEALARRAEIENAEPVKCFRCRNPFNPFTGGTNQINSEELCWECVSVIANDPQAECDCDEGDPCVMHQAIHALDGEMWERRRR